MKKIACVKENICVACGECELSCKRSAIAVLHGITAKVDRMKCVGCGLCTKNCPANCIEVMEREQ